MEEESTSWVTRAKFSHTVFVRSNSSRTSADPFSAQPDHDSELNVKCLSSEPKLKSLSLELKPNSSGHDLGSKGKSLSLDSSSSSPSVPICFDSSSLPNQSSVEADRKVLPKAKISSAVSSSSPSAPLSSQPDSGPELKLKSKDLHLDSNNFSFQPLGVSELNSKWSDSKMASTPSLRVKSPDPSERNSKPRRRSISPLPTTILSDVFKEAKAIGKRFSTPPPSRKVSDKGSSRGAHDRRLNTSTSPPNTSPVRLFSSMKAPEKSKSKKDASWARYFDHGGGKVTAVETTEEWMVDLSKLYLGLRFDSGAHSKLYRGIYKDQPVAVKIVRQPDGEENKAMAARLEKQFVREVTFLSHLYHRNVIKLAGACKSPPVFCIITEYLSGGSLRAFLHKLEHKSLPLEKLIAIALEIARGLEYIHSRGIIHRDLKPENILFDKDFCVKIADFGIACEEAYCDALADDPGTYRWMAPEMIKHRSYGRKVDVYSFGLVLWEMLTGRIPYEEMIPIQAAFAVVNKNLRPVIPDDCPAALRALIEQCWALHPEKRPEFWQIVKVLEQFESVLAQEGTLDQLPCLTCQDHKNRLLHWIQKLRPSHVDDSVPSAPKLL